MRHFVLVFCLCLLPQFNTVAANLKIAVASNFKSTAQKLATEFEQQSAHKITLVSASTGALYSLIYHGAPYDIFLSADEIRPQKLVDADLAYPDSLLTYAIGQLAFWMPQQENLVLDNVNHLIQQQTGKLAIANPRLAPYGKSTSEYLKYNNLDHTVKGKLVRGNNVTQVLHFVETGNAQSGFVSYSELLNAGVEEHFVLLRRDSYPAINQQGVILRRSKNLAAAKAFMSFIKGPGCETILLSGYAIPSFKHAEKG